MRTAMLQTLSVSFILALLLIPALGPVSQAADPAAAAAALGAPERGPAGGSREALDPYWVQRTPVTIPAARTYHAMAYDSARGVTVLFGGSGVNPSDTWEWDGFSWVERTPAARPSVRFYHAMAYDSARGVTVLFGGHNNAAELGDTWEWDGVNWVQRSPATVPPARHAHAMAYDSARGVTVLFGGYDGSAYRNDTWEWDGVNWVQRSPATVPPARVIHAMAYDSARGVTVLFGGHPVYLDDTWEWNGVNWLQRAPATVPPGRESHAMAYDSAHGVTVLFGGKDGNGQRDDTWVWDGTDWELRTPSPTPPARMGHAMSYDSAHGVTVLFGGSYEDPISHYLDDTWEYGWLILSPPVLLAISNPDGDGEYLVDWNEVTGAATYQLQEDDNSAFTSPTERYYGTNSHYDVSGQQGGTWYYRVRASNPLGDSPWSGIQAVTVRWRVHLPLVLRGVP